MHPMNRLIVIIRDTILPVFENDSGPDRAMLKITKNIIIAAKKAIPPNPGFLVIFICLSLV